MLVSVFTNSLGRKSITETTGDGDEKIKEPLEEEEAALLRSSIKSHLMEAARCRTQHSSVQPHCSRAGGRAALKDSGSTRRGLK